MFTEEELKRRRKKGHVYSPKSMRTSYRLYKLRDRENSNDKTRQPHYRGLSSQNGIMDKKEDHHYEQKTNWVSYKELKQRVSIKEILSITVSCRYVSEKR